MQFKEQKGKVQVLVYSGYDKEKRRAIVKMVGSFDRYDYSLSVGLLDSLTVEQKEELQSEIERRRQSHDNAMRQASILYSDSRIKEYADIVSSGEYDIPAEKAAEIWEAMDLLARSLKRLDSKNRTERILRAFQWISLSYPLLNRSKALKKRNKALIERI